VPKRQGEEGVTRPLDDEVGISSAALERKEAEEQLNCIRDYLENLVNKGAAQAAQSWAETMVRDAPNRKEEVVGPSIPHRKEM
jgi:hypothetical protein